jgi:hypothetical protein
MSVLIRLHRPSHTGKSQNRARAQGFAAPRKTGAPLHSARGSASMALRRAAPAGWRLLTTPAAEHPRCLINPRGVYTESRTLPPCWVCRLSRIPFSLPSLRRARPIRQIVRECFPLPPLAGVSGMGLRLLYVRYLAHDDHQNFNFLLHLRQPRNNCSKFIE